MSKLPLILIVEDDRPVRSLISMALKSRGYQQETVSNAQEAILIYDKTHQAALVYQNRQAKIVPLEGIAFPEADEMEEGYRALWKRFYKTISIEARENPRCRMTHMPKRYWENMTEMVEFL